MLFHRNTKKVIRVLSIIIGVLIIISMAVLYTPILNGIG